MRLRGRSMVMEYVLIFLVSFAIGVIATRYS